jgi:hypothetical protein
MGKFTISMVSHYHMWPAELFFEADLDWDSRDIRSTSAGFFAPFSAQIIFSWLENVNKNPISYLFRVHSIPFHPRRKQDVPWNQQG